MQDSRAPREEHDGQPNAHETGPDEADARGRQISAEPATAASENHARLVSVFRATPIGIGLVCHRVLMEVNDRLCQMTGYRPEELLGQNARILYPTQEDYEYVGTVKYEQIARRGTGTVETRWKRKDGELLNILLSSTPLDLDDHSKGVTFTALDITEYCRAKQEMENLARFPSENPYPVFRIARTGEILYANPAGIPLLTEAGTSAGSQAPTAWCTLVHQILDGGHVGEFESEHGGLTFAFRAVPLPNVACVNFYGIDITDRKQAKAKLAESEERYRSIFANAVLGMYRTTPDGRILAANPALVRMLGYDSFEELAQRNLEQDGCYAPGQSRSLFKEALLTNGQVVGFESSWIRRDGATLFVRENAKVIRDEQGNAPFYEGTVEDLTARRKAEEDLQNIFNLSLDMVCIADINTSTFVRVNPAFTRVLGYDEAELLGRPFLDFIHPDDVERTAAVVRESLRAGESVLNFEDRYRCKDGSYRWLSWTSQPKPEQGLTYSVARDITRQKQAVTALRESERRYRAVVEDQTEFICRFAPDRRITFVNEAICRFFGKSREKLIGKSFAGFMPAEEYRKLNELLASLTPDHPFETHDNRGLLPSGQEFWGRWTNRALFDDAGTLVEFQSVGHDVTERRRMVDALRKGEERYRLLVDSAGQPIFTISRDGAFLLMNRTAAAILGGGQPDDFAGKTIWELFPKDVADGHMEDVRRAIDSGQLVAVTRESVAQGEKRWYDARVQPIHDGGDSHYALVILTDVTQAKCAEEALRQSL